MWEEYLAYLDTNLKIDTGQEGKKFSTSAPRSDKHSANKRTGKFFIVFFIVLLKSIFLHFIPLLILC